MEQIIGEKFPASLLSMVGRKTAQAAVSKTKQACTVTSAGACREETDTSAKKMGDQRHG
jgi:hypothetical protein